jgi:hypothetical protein
MALGYELVRVLAGAGKFSLHRRVYPALEIVYRTKLFTIFIDINRYFMRYAIERIYISRPMYPDTVLVSSHGHLQFLKHILGYLNRKQLLALL